MKGSKIKSSTTQSQPISLTTNNSTNIKSSLSKSKNFNTTNTPNVEEEYISNLQKQIYYLELEMKLMKDKEIDTKNKIGGFEVLFRDGVPLNEHFIALKTKYKNERDFFENHINDLKKEISEIESENNFIQNQIEDTNKNYFGFLEKISNDRDFYQTKIFDLNTKLINENNSKESLTKRKEIIGKSLYKFNSENIHRQRTIEKKKLFKESLEEKNLNTKQKNLEKLNETEKLLERSLIDKVSIEIKLENNSKIKQIENENNFLILEINKLERDFHLAQAKIIELENIQILNKKYLTDEELTKRIYEKENKKINEELENLSRINDEALKQKVKENERKKIVSIKHQISHNELKMGMLLEQFMTEENFAKSLLDEKNSLLKKISQANEDNENLENKERELRQEKIDVKNFIDQHEIWIEETEIQMNELINENEKLKKISERNEVEIKNIHSKSEELQQKIELNSILKDIDINELKMLSQNNAIVNHSINNLMTKWDKIHTKLQEIEDKSKSLKN